MESWENFVCSENSNVMSIVRKVSSMSDRKKFPAIHTAPLVKRPPDLPDDLFKGCSGSKNKTYSSRPFKEKEGFKDYAKDLYKAFKKNGKGKILFPDESQFLTELDTAQLHYEMYRPIVTPAISGTLKEQREYFVPEPMPNAQCPMPESADSLVWDKVFPLLFSWVLPGFLSQSSSANLADAALPEKERYFLRV